MESSLRRIRLSRKMSQAALAGHLGVKKDAVSKWETGKVRLSVETAKRIKDILGCSLMDLLGEATPFDEVGPLSPQEKSHILALRQLGEAERQAVYTITGGNVRKTGPNKRGG